MRACAWLAATLALVASTVGAAELKSGLGKGEFVNAFYVTDVTGPSKGEELCYRCKFGDRPVVCVFAKEMTPEVAELTKAIDGVVAKNEEARMAGFVVVLSDSEKAAAACKEAATSQKIAKVPLTTSKESHGPASYKLNPEADVTVMMWVDGAVKVSKGFQKGQLKKDAVQALVADTKQILE
ncbi:MAG TPA: hypothetical protein VFG20_04690 [Planctomycetaceae bacterium]|nr:hypothetical protein [Planctomycetaceae bacterium]